MLGDNWDNSLKTELGKTALTAAVMVAATLVAASLIFGLWCRRNRKREGAKIDPGTPPTSTRPSNSVKDHINRLSEEGLLISKILISDPKQIKQYPVDMITYEKDLGEGQFGQVFQGRNNKQTNEQMGQLREYIMN